VTVLVAATPVSADTTSLESARASSSYVAMRQYLDLGRSDLWAFSQALAASLELAALPGGAAYRADVRTGIAALDRYTGLDGAYESAPNPPFGDGGPEYYDDNEWVALDLLRAAELLGDPVALTRARQLFTFVTTGWDRDPRHGCPGGIFWTRDPRNGDRNAVTTANGALLALGLYRRTGSQPYLDWATTMYGWVTRCLVSPDGLVFDHRGVDGSLNTAVWSYNQGAMIAAGVGLYHATGRRIFLRHARIVARAALDYYTRTGWAGQPACFVAIFFRDLRLLDQVRPDRRYGDAARQYADARWLDGRDPTTGLFAGTGSDAPLLEQAGMVQIYAGLATH
jgi:hypothetical protein